MLKQRVNRIRQYGEVIKVMHPPPKHAAAAAEQVKELQRDLNGRKNV